jgi:hypothetical protein
MNHSSFPVATAALLTLATSLSAPLAAQGHPKVRANVYVNQPIGGDFVTFGVRPSVLGQNRETMLVGYVCVAAADQTDWANLAKSVLPGITPSSEASESWLTTVRDAVGNSDIHIEGATCTIPTTYVIDAIAQIQTSTMNQPALSQYTRPMYVATGSPETVFATWPDSGWTANGSLMNWHASAEPLTMDAFDTETFLRNLLARQFTVATQQTTFADDPRINLLIQMITDGIALFELHLAAIEYQSLPGSPVTNQRITMSATTPVQLQLSGQGNSPDFYFRYAIGDDYFYPGVIDDRVYIEPAVLPPVGYTPDYQVMIMRADNTYSLVPAAPATAPNLGIEFTCPAWAVPCYAALLDMNTGQPISLAGPNGVVTTFGFLPFGLQAL